MAAALRFRESFELLRDGAFARFFFARGISAFGSSMVFVALPFAVLEVAGSDKPEYVGYVIACTSFAQILVQLFAGALADRHSRRRIMVVADACAALAQAVLAALLLSGAATVPRMMVLGALIGVCFAFHWPSGFALVPLLVPKRKLQAANALISIAHTMSWGLGAAAGGVISAYYGAGVAIAGDAASFALSALLVATLRSAAQPTTASSSLLRDIQKGWREFTAHRWLWTIVAQFSLLVMGFHATYAVIGPIVADRALEGVRDWGAVSFAFGLGLVCGGLLAMRLSVSRPMLVGTLCVLPLALLPLSLIGPLSVPAIAGAAFLGGAGIEFFSVNWSTSLHTHVAPEALSRVAAYDSVGSMMFAPLGEALAGKCVGVFGAQQTLSGAALLILVPTLLVLLVPEVRALRAAPAGSETRAHLQ